MQTEKTTSAQHTVRGTGETESQPGPRTTLNCIHLIIFNAIWITKSALPWDFDSC